MIDNLSRNARVQCQTMFQTRVWLLLFVLGCTASAEEVRPPRDQFVYPSALATARDGTHLFVVNANATLQYDSGSLLVVDGQRVRAAADGWVTGGALPSGCTRDTDPSIAVCDESAYVLGEAGVRLGNFAAGVAVTQLANGSDRVHVTVRGDPSITWAEWNGATLACGADGQTFSLCDDTHRLLRVSNSDDLPALVGEPFGIAGDSAGEFAMVTHLTSAAVTLVHSPSDRPPYIADIAGGLFTAAGSSGIAIRGTGPNAVAYVANRADDRVVQLTTMNTREGSKRVVPGEYFLLNGVASSAGDSANSREIAFGRQGDVLAVVNRDPNALHFYDTSRGPDGRAAHELLGAVDLCREAATVDIVSSPDGERAIVTCFREGLMYVARIDGAPRLEAVTLLGRGPAAAVVSDSLQTLFVANYLEDTIAVVDLAPSSPRRFQVVMRLGVPR